MGELILKKAITQIEQRILINNMKSQWHSKETNEFDIFKVPFLPSISMYEYIYNTLNITKACGGTFIYTLSLMLRLDNKYSCLTVFNIFTIYYTCLYIAIKLNEDIVFDYDKYCEIGGIGKKKLYILEMLILKALNYNINISKEEFEHTLNVYLTC